MIFMHEYCDALANKLLSSVTRKKTQHLSQKETSDQNIPRSLDLQKEELDFSGQQDCEMRTEINRMAT